MATEKNKLIVLEPCTKNVEDLLALVLQKDQAEIVRTQSAEEATQLVIQLQPCMLVACIQENGEVPSRVNLMKRLEPVIKKGMLKSFITSKLKNRQLSTLITSFGVTDFIEEPAPVRTMQFKANLQLKALETIRKQMEMKKASQEQIVFKKSEAKKGEEATVGQDTAAKLKPALQLEQDSFLFKNSGAKKVGKKFVVEMEGPDPATGDWVPHEDKGDAKSSWRWMPKEEDGTPKPAEGEGWVHEGEKPEFKDASGKWQFASEKPDLSFRKKGEKVATKLSVDEKGELQVAEDSPVAEENVKKNRALARAKREKTAPTTNDKTGAKTADSNSEPTILGKSGAGPRTDAADLARKLGSGVGESQAEAEAAFNNQTGGLKDAPAGEFNELKFSEPDSASPPEAAAAATTEAEEKKPLSPLEFLQKKKKQKVIDAAARLGKDLPEESSASPDVIEATEQKKSAKKIDRDETPELTAGKPAKPKKSSAEAAQEALARMKAKMGSMDKLVEESAAADNAQATGEADAPSEGNEPADTTSAEEQGKSSAAKKSAAGSPPDSPPSREKAAKLEKVKKERKRSILAEVQGILDEALPTQLPPAEEERLRRKHQPEGADPLPPRELARKERLSRVKELKDRLANLDDELRASDAEEAPTNVHDLKHEEENTSSLKGFANEERRAERRAFDGEAGDSAEEKDGKISLAREAKESKQRRDAEERFVYLPEADLTPSGGAWEKAGDEHYAFLPAEVRYRGFDKIEDLLPLWIFRGEKVPELLDKTKQWRFLARLPTQARTASEVPAEVRDFLLALRDQLKREKAAKEEDPEKAQTGGDQAESLKEIFAEKKKKKSAGDDLAAKLERLKSGLSDNDEAAASEAGAEATEEAAAQAEDLLGEKKKNRDADTSGSEEFSDAKKKDLREGIDAEEDALENERKARGEDAVESEDFAANKKRDEKEGDGTSAEELTGKKRKNEPGQALGDKLAALKAQLGADDMSTDSSADEKTDRAEEPAAAATPSLAKVSKSAAFQAFEERRKNKVRAEAPAAAVPTPSREPYLGIYVALSNAIGQSGEFEKSLQRVLAAVEGSFGACSAVLLHPADASTPGRARIRIATGAFESTDTVSLGEGSAFPVVQGDGVAEEILGYLYLKANGERSAFEPGEEAAARKAAMALWPVLVTAARQLSDRKEAA